MHVYVFVFTCFVTHVKVRDEHTGAGSFLQHVVPWVGTQVVRTGGMQFYTLNHLASTHIAL